MSVHASGGGVTLTRKRRRLGVVLCPLTTVDGGRSVCLGSPPISSWVVIGVVPVAAISAIEMSATLWPEIVVALNRATIYTGPSVIQISIFVSVSRDSRPTSLP